MPKLKTYSISVEVLKYPYCGKSIESKKFLSEKICYSITRVRKNTIKKTKWLILSGDFILRITNGAVPCPTIENSFLTLSRIIELFTLSIKS